MPNPSSCYFIQCVKLSLIYGADREWTLQNMYVYMYNVNTIVS